MAWCGSTGFSGGGYHDTKRTIYYIRIFFSNDCCEANECIALKSISIYAEVLEIDSSPNITMGFLSASALVSMNTRALAFSYFAPFSG